MNKKALVVVGAIILVAAVLVWKQNRKPAPSNTSQNPSSLPIPTSDMKITSPSFVEGGIIPDKFSCKAAQPVNPELKFSGVPKAARSLVLIMHDPDASLRGFTHWVVYNMPVQTSGIPENSTPSGVQGKNGKGTNVYIGPCPPSGTHRYFFYLYALDIDLPDNPSQDKVAVENAMYKHILEQSQLMANFSH